MSFKDALQKYKIQLGSVLVLLLVCYAQVIWVMAQWWYKDDNYSHGFLVPLIAGYFFWQRWPELKEKTVTPSMTGLVVSLLGLLQLLAGYLATEYFSMRTSLVVVLAGMVLYFFGTGILRKMALPLGYLLLMVPIPYILYDMLAFPLKLFVTKVSVGFLQLVGVVVMREGNVILFPSTTLEVADACSGIRSLMSLVALAVAFAFFLNISNIRRWIIILSAIPIAVATNALRVIVTGILAQWWGAKAAEGFFHEFAGLAVFALAIVLLVFVGFLLKKGVKDSAVEDTVTEKITDEPETAVVSADNKAAEQSVAEVISARLPLLPISRFVFVALFLIVTTLYMNLHTDIAVPVNRPFSQFPLDIANWKMQSQTSFSSQVLGVLRPTDYLYRAYQDVEGKTVTLYIGYHSGGKESGEIHSPKHCLPGSGWHELSSRSGLIDLDGKPLKIVRSLYQKDAGKELFLYWFQVKGKSLSDEYSLKLAEITNSFLYRRRDSAFIRVSVPFETDEARAVQLGERFVKDFYPLIQQYLPQ